MHRPRAAHLLLPALLLLLLPAGSAAQSAADVLGEVRDEYQRRAEGIESYTVVQRIMGQETSVRFVRREIDGIVVFQPEGMDEMMEGAFGGNLDPAFIFRPEAGARMTYEGRDEVGGEACHELSLQDFEGLGLEEMMSDGDAGFRPGSMRMCIDDDEHLVRRMVMTGTARGMGEPRELTMTTVMSDYREVGGMMHPYRVEMTTEGLEMAQSPEMAEAMARMREQMEQLPEAQREQMEAMMESRMEAMQGAMGMVAGEPVVIETVEVRINEGPSGG